MGNDEGEIIGVARRPVEVWRPRHVAGVEVVRGIATPHSTPRHFHEELEIGVKQGGGWEFHHRGTWHAVAPGILVLTAPGDVHRARSPSEADGAVFHSLRFDADLIGRTATDLALHLEGSDCLPLPLHCRHAFQQLYTRCSRHTRASPRWSRSPSYDDRETVPTSMRRVSSTSVSEETPL